MFVCKCQIHFFFILLVSVFTTGLLEYHCKSRRFFNPDRRSLSFRCRCSRQSGTQPLCQRGTRGCSHLGHSTPLKLSPWRFNCPHYPHHRQKDILRFWVPVWAKKKSLLGYFKLHPDLWTLLPWRLQCSRVNWCLNLPATGWTKSIR